ncbi:MAG: hypothetical protein UU51_C0017G0005 [Microgenomates group bacterium GW2011_GWC1_41_20]|uniref:Uncharacterized protein n=1 Tax=Candidatus Woesebacteria bacterium GW2011_GWF1_40_24 TaxID=1618601 RepID=A0A0G0RWX0_9BACT|nr:MAG: hypothetical protein UT93_C0038G0010 [Candidatus Woesebacteria bacterium GW2011_GWF1_40_24]KKS00128.1 MAG: hypothetical protein UU51_C0017G0005 [Microgenomates group bacterium GW2011_GWC1_41_20]
MSSPSILRVNPIGSILAQQEDLLSPGVLRSKCLDHKHSGQWFLCLVPIEVLEMMARQVRHLKDA